METLDFPQRESFFILATYAYERTHSSSLIIKGELP